MSLISSITGVLAGNTQTQQVTTGPQDQVIFFVLSLIPQQEEIRPLLKQFEEAKAKTGIEKELAYASLYLAFEDFLAKSKPPIVTQTYAPEDLRAEVKKKIQIATLPLAMQVIFSDSKTQPFLIYELLTYRIVEFVIKSIGVARFRQIAQAAVPGTYLSGALIYEQGIDFAGIHENLSKLSPQDLTATFITFNLNFYKGVVSCLGSVPASEFYYRGFESIKHTFPQDIASIALPIIPKGIVQQ